MRRLLLLSVAMVALVTSVSLAADLTKQQTIERSAPICRDLLEAIQPHIEKANDARAKEQWERFIHEVRLAIRSARPYGRELRQLQEPDGAWRYRRFLDEAREALDSLGRALDALEDGHMKLALRREETAQEHLRRSRRAAKHYGLRRPCIRVVS